MMKALAVGVAALIAAAPASAATYVGSYQVDDGPVWTSNPAVYSVSEAAALLFGGTALDYDISTVSDDPLLIDHMGWYTAWGVFGGQMYQEDFKWDAGAPGYNDPGGTGTAISAYTWDNALGSTYTNYVFRVDSVGAVPEPSTWAMMLLGFGLVGGATRASRRRRKVTVSYA